MNASEMNQQAPKRQLKTNRTWVKFTFLSIITFGIYGMIGMGNIESSVNLLASRYDGKSTMNYWLMSFVLSPITGGIAWIVWSHKLSNRMGAELKRRGINYDFDAGTYWIWAMLGSLIIVGPYVYLHKMLKAANLLCEDYNRVG